jgi:hypothetical protein
MTRSAVWYTWSIVVHNTSHPAGDVRVLSLLASNRSFSQDSSTKTICVAIEKSQSCCEEWGIEILYPHGLEKSTMEGINVTSVHWAPQVQEDDDDHHTAVVVIETERGAVKVKMWNNHNGYYSHSIKMSWEGHEDFQQL